MFAREDGRLGRQARLLRLNTLLGLRWFAIAGQTSAILIGAFVFGLRFPVLACLGLVGASAALNLALRWRFPVSIRLSERGATIMLGYDILQLAGLLFLTGGVANPFVLFFLAPVTIAATSLTFRQALALLGLALVCATALLRASLPMPWLAGENLTLPPLYVFGLWTAFAASAGFRGVLRLSRRRGGPPERERAHRDRARARARPSSLPDRRAGRRCGARTRDAARNRGARRTGDGRTIRQPSKGSPTTWRCSNNRSTNVGPFWASCPSRRR